jgi:hypothetical protein
MKSKTTEPAAVQQTKTINNVTYVFDGKGWRKQ